METKEKKTVWNENLEVSGVIFTLFLSEERKKIHRSRIQCTYLFVSR